MKIKYDKLIEKYNDIQPKINEYHLGSTIDYASLNQVSQEDQIIYDNVINKCGVGLYNIKQVGVYSVPSRLQTCC